MLERGLMDLGFLPLGLGNGEGSASLVDGLVDYFFFCQLFSPCVRLDRNNHCILKDRMPACCSKGVLRAVAMVCALAVGAAQEGPEDRRQIFREIETSLQVLQDITGLQAKKRINYDLITRDKVNQFLKERVKDAVKPEELRAEELTLKKLGFVPPDFDLAKSTVDLLTEQAAAFYDYHKKKLFLTDWAPSAMQQTALVHELAHALADQNFHLERFISQAGKSDDSGLARMAVMEGQATWLMTEVLARGAGQSLATDSGLLEAANGGVEPGATQFPVFNSVPLYLRETLIFPYTEGSRFQQAVFRKMGQAAFAEVFRRPPDTSQQILHPAKYFDHVEPVTPPFPALSLGKGYKELAEGMLGELDHAILIRQYGTAQQAEAIAPHWKAGRYSLLENRSKSRIVLRYLSQWDSPETARDFFQFYAQVLPKKWKKMEVLSQSEDTLSGTGDDGYFVVKLTGSQVSSVEGLASTGHARAPAMR
jgi:hypothetical protein